MREAIQELMEVFGISENVALYQLRECSWDLHEASRRITEGNGNMAEISESPNNSQEVTYNP